jgi:putative flippase GtrA
MIEKIRALCIKYREIIVYLIVGVLTTIVAWGCKFLFNWIFYGGTALPTVAQNTVLSIVENVSGIAFAYPTNRRWVFRSTEPKIFREFTGFFASRLGTWGLSYVLNLLLANVLGVEYHITTILVSVVVVVGNYVISKFLIFRKKGKGEKEDEEA